MKSKEFNSNLVELSNIVIPLNQLLYEIIILICFHFLLSNIRDNKPDTTNGIKKTTQSFIILVILLVIAVDWFIWNNVVQTSFFICILAVYIYYNLQNITIISTFINLSKDIYNASPIIPAQPTHTPTNIDVMPIPEIFLNANATPQPYNATTTDTKEIHEVYKTDKPYISITDTKYAEIMLNDLYTTQQYQNIQPNEIDTTLDNNLHLPPKTISNEELLNSFRNPKKEFLDKKWLSSPRTYNDTCISCTHPHKQSSSTTILDKTQSNTQNKNAICTVVPFGRQLSECTNQDNTITRQQLESISENKVLPLQL